MIAAPRGRNASWHRVRSAIGQVLTSHLEPRAIGAAVAVGVLVGCVPIYGLHLVVCAVLARAFGLNVGVVYAAANISNPVLAPALVTSELVVGSYARGRPLPSLHALEAGPWALLASAPDTAATLLLGSLIVGATLGVGLGAASYGLATWGRHSPVPPLVMLAGVGGYALIAAVAAGWLAPWRALVVDLGLFGAAIGVVVAASARPELQWFGPAIVRGGHPRRVALTFDDGPDPASTPALLATLADAGAKATFFVLADRVARWPELFRAIVASGHEVGLHGNAHHPWLTFWAPERGAADLRAGLAVLAAHGAGATKWFRPPFGVTSPRLHAAVARTELVLAWCSIRTFDGGSATAEQILARCGAAQGGDVVLLHEGARLTVGLLPGILADLHARGLQASTLSDVLEAS